MAESDYMLRRCTRCKKEQRLDQFCKDRSLPCGLSIYCRGCHSEKYESKAMLRRAEQSAKHQKALEEQAKVCTRCKCSLDKGLFGKSSKAKDGLKPRCRECHNIANAEYRRRNPDAQRASSDRWRRLNPERVRAAAAKRRKANPAKFSAYTRKHRAKDLEASRMRDRERNALPHIAPMRALGQRIRSLLGGKESITTASLVGYTGHELREHLERQFEPGMNWDNYGEWHVDHIIPLSSFCITSLNDPELRRAWGLPNLRPLWAKENLRKRAHRTHLI